MPTRRPPNASSAPPRTAVGARRRNSARLALYVSLVVIGALLATLLAWMRPSLEFGMMTGWRDVDWESFPEVQLLQQYVRIDTSVPPEGDPVAGARWLSAQLLSMGLIPVIEDVGGEANLWAVLEGEEPGAVVLHNHIDVDPITHEEWWEHDPFGAVIEGPWLFGRGAFDMKSVTIAQLQALRRLVESGRKPRRSVIFLATTGEESGSDLGTKWVLRNEPELVERFEVVITEGGAVEGRSMEEFHFWGTEFVQKRLVDVTLCGPKAALEPLAEELQEAGYLASEPRLVPEVERFLRLYAPTRIAEDLRRTLSAPEELVRDPEAFAALSRYQKSFFQNELLPQAFVETPGAWELRLRAVLLPGEDRDRALQELLPDWKRHGLGVLVFDEGASPHGSSVDHWAFTALDGVMDQHRPEVLHGPLVLTLTVTDARFFRDAGIPTYGFSPFAVLTPHVMQIRRATTVNERMLLPGFMEGVELYGEVLERLANVPVEAGTDG